MPELEPRKQEKLAQLTLPEDPLYTINLYVSNGIFSGYQRNLENFFKAEVEEQLESSDLTNQDEALRVAQTAETLFGIDNARSNEELPKEYRFTVTFEEGLTPINAFHIRGPYDVRFRYVEDQFDKNGESIFDTNESNTLIYKEDGSEVLFEFEVNIGTQENPDKKIMQLPVTVEGRGQAYKGRPTDSFMSTSWEREQLDGEDLKRFDAGKKVMKKKYRVDKFMWAYAFKTYPNDFREFKSNYIAIPIDRRA